MSEPQPRGGGAHRRREDRVPGSGGRGPWLRWLGLGALLGAAVVALGVWGLTQTKPGREYVVRRVLTGATGRFHGSVVAENLPSNLLTGIRLKRVSVLDTAGQVWVEADSAFINYKLRTLLAGDVVLDRVTLFQPRIRIFKLPGDTVWNYQAFFRSRNPNPTSTGTSVLIDGLLLRRADVAIDFTWEPDPELGPTARDSSIRANLADTSLVVVRRVPGGFARLVRLRHVDAELRGLHIKTGDRGGVRVGVRDFRGDVHAFRGPLRVRSLGGEATVADGVVQFRVDSARLPGTRAAGFGTVKLDDGPDPDLSPDVDAVLRLAPFAFRDLHSFLPRLPDQGGGQMLFGLEDRPDGRLYSLRQMAVRAPRTRLSGDLNVVVGDTTVRFGGVRLRASPLDVATAERLVPVPIPIPFTRLIVAGGELVSAPAPTARVRQNP